MSDNIFYETYRCPCCRKLYNLNITDNKHGKDVVIKDLQCCPSGKLLGLLVRMTRQPKCHRCGTLITNNDVEDIREGLSYGRKCSLCGESLFEIRVSKHIKY